MNSGKDFFFDFSSFRLDDDDEDKAKFVVVDVCLSLFGAPGTRRKMFLVLNPKQNGSCTAGKRKQEEVAEADVNVDTVDVLDRADVRL